MVPPAGRHPRSMTRCHPVPAAHPRRDRIFLCFSACRFAGTPRLFPPCCPAPGMGGRHCAPPGSRQKTITCPPACPNRMFSGLSAPLVGPVPGTRPLSGRRAIMTDSAGTGHSVKTLCGVIDLAAARRPATGTGFSQGFASPVPISPITVVAPCAAVAAVRWRRPVHPPRCPAAPTPAGLRAKRGGIFWRLFSPPDRR